jgi:hypothetical protein
VVLLKKAPLLMLVTGYPLVVLGMFNTVGFPVYPVIVIAPLLVVNVNCARTTACSSTATSRQIPSGFRFVFKFRFLSLVHVFNFPSNPILAFVLPPPLFPERGLGQLALRPPAARPAQQPT